MSASRPGGSCSCSGKGGVGSACVGSWVAMPARYPGGMALRFARVKRHRPDKSAAEADTVDTVRAIHVPGDPAGETGQLGLSGLGEDGA